MSLLQFDSDATSFAASVAAMDRDVMESLGGEPVLYQPAVGAPVTVTGMFDEQYVLAKGDAEAGVEAAGPEVFFRLEDLPVDSVQDKPTLTIRGLNYRVLDHQPDGLGGIVLALRLVV